jgi:glutamate racemase
MNSAPIGVFDSGVGGLSVLRAVRHALPGESLLYVADSAYAPYGDKSEDYIQQRSQNMVAFLADAGAKAVVVACNTATAVAIQGLRSRFPFPIVAIEPAVKPAAALTKSGVIGILATSQTLASEKFSRLVEQHGRGVRVLLQPCPGLVEQVEKGELDGARTQSLLSRYVSPLLEQGADTLVLGCTHYPFLIDAIIRMAGSRVTLVDPAVAVAMELQRRLAGSRLLSSVEATGTEQFWTSGAPATVQTVIRQLWAGNVEVQPIG